MIRQTNNYILLLFMLFLFIGSPLFATDIANAAPEEEEFNVKEMILSHIADSHEWHFMDWKDKQIILPLPVILYSKESRWNFFLSSKLKNEDAKFYIANEGRYAGKIVERTASGEETAPLDLSMTKNAVSLIFTSILLIVIVMSIARHYKGESIEGKKGVPGAIEFVIVFMIDEVIKPSIGKEYKRFAPFLLTLFFFILLNNLMGLIPIFPGGTNVTGNITVTMGLAIVSYLVINLTGSKHYYKGLFWPDVPTMLKAPVPLMPVIELVGTITKPFALMIRLFANITAGHSIVLGLMSVIFVTVKMGSAINTGMTVVAILFSIFIGFLEILVSFIQAYIFTMLTAVFIGMAREPERPQTQEIKTNK